MKVKPARLLRLMSRNLLRSPGFYSASILGARCMMTVRAHCPRMNRFMSCGTHRFEQVIYVGIILSIVFSGWVIVANHLPSLDRFALARNLTAVVLLGLVALIPFFDFGACREICWPRALWRGPFSAWPIAFCAWILRALRSVSALFKSSCSAPYFICSWLLFAGYGPSSSRARASHESHPNHHPS